MHSCHTTKRRASRSAHPSESAGTVYGAEYRLQCIGNDGGSLYLLQFPWKYEGHLENKERFAITKIFIDNRKEKEYAGFMTHLHLLLHTVTLDIEALVVP